MSAGIELTAPPSPESVVIWLTTTVERDYKQRGIFPSLRYANALGFKGAATRHFLTSDHANQLLADAVAREQATGGGLRNAYRAHLRSIQAAVEEAAMRPAELAAMHPIVVREGRGWTRLRGTKDQLRRHGIRLEGPWPREPGGGARASDIWPTFSVLLTLPLENASPPPPAHPAVDIDEINHLIQLGERERDRQRGVEALGSMGMLHRRKLPDGWRVIEGQRQG
jgi:hypothetical protein